MGRVHSAISNQLRQKACSRKRIEEYNSRRDRLTEQGIPLFSYWPAVLASVVDVHSAVGLSRVYT